MKLVRCPFTCRPSYLGYCRNDQLQGWAGQQNITLDIRVIAATNRDLKASILDHAFREDLYFRLSAFKITSPPLRERPLDIVPLAYQFLDTKLSKGRSLRITSESAELLVSYHWPGNVRELQNVIIRAQVLSSQGLIEPEHLIFDDLPEAFLPAQEQDELAYSNSGLGERYFLQIIQGQA